MTFKADMDNYALIHKNIELSCNFARKFIKSKIQIKCLEALCPEKFSKPNLEEFIKILSGLPYECSAVKPFYTFLFDSTQAPSIKTILNILTNSFKKEVIEKIREQINES